MMKPSIILLTAILTITPLGVLAKPFTAGLSALGREHAPTAFRAWMKLAEAGEAEAQNNVAFLYERGLGVKQDYELAEEWYEKAAAQQLPEAYHNLAMLTYQGHINAKNYKKSIEWFTAASELGLTTSTYMLGVMYYQGQGVFKNARKSLPYFEEAARQGDPRAQYMLSYLFQSGESNEAKESDFFKAYVWSSIALAGGFDKASSIRTAAGLELDDAQEDEATTVMKNCLETEFATCL